MENPFLKSKAGVFGAASNESGGTILPERICAALARAISSDNSKILDQEWWTYAVNQVPHLALVASVTGLVDVTNPALVAGACLGSPINAALPQAKGALIDWIGTIPEPATLNSLIVALGQGGEINMSLAFVSNAQTTVASQSGYQRTDFVINYSNSLIAKELQEIFTRAEPLSAQPYYLRIPPIA